MTMETMDQMKKVIATSIFEVFEKMFFIYLEPVEKKNDLTFDMETEIKFTGSAEGCMKMFFSDGLASLMARNMLSLDDEEVTDALKADCSREAINMVCGSLLRTCDSRIIFNLSIPTFQKNHPSDPFPFQQKAQLNSWQSLFDVDGESLGVLLQMQRP